jgi:curved DNA-binding protein CbpA
MEVSLLPYQPERDVYRLLGVPPSADAAQIATACRRLARTFHPDRNGSPRAHTEMQVVNAVRALLADPQARAEYDRSRLSFLAARRPASVKRTPKRPAPTATREVQREPMAPPALEPDLGLRDWRRTARAMMAGLVASLSALAPDRCPACTAPIEASYRFCGACGEPLAPATP